MDQNNRLESRDERQERKKSNLDFIQTLYSLKEIIQVLKRQTNESNTSNLYSLFTKSQIRGFKEAFLRCRHRLSALTAAHLRAADQLTLRPSNSLERLDGSTPRRDSESDQIMSILSSEENSQTKRREIRQEKF